MKKLLIITTLFLLNNAFGQLEELEALKSIYYKVDSVKELNKPFVITDDFNRTLEELNKLHPTAYFIKFNDYLDLDKFDECAFLYNLGVLRFQYYNQTNKKYEASGDGALFSSLKYISGESIFIYLKNDIDKYLEILKAVDQYVENNDYLFHSKQINEEKYRELRFTALIETLIENRNDLETEWKIEREEILINIDKTIEQFKNLTEEERNKLMNMQYEEPTKSKKRNRK